MSSSIPTESKPRSRRALLAGAIGGLGAVAASAIGRVSPAQAANGDPVLLGQVNSATANTQVTKTNLGGIAIRGTASGGGEGVRGDGGATGVSGSGSISGVEGVSAAGTGVVAVSNTGTGLFATTGNGIGLDAFSNAGVAIRAESVSVQGIIGKGAIGVEGTSTSEHAWGVGGYNQVGGIGVWGQASGGANNRGVAGISSGGVGVWAEADGGYALRALGRTRFSTSGVASIAAGQTTKVVTPGVNIVSGSFVLLTPKANIGTRSVWFTTNATNDTFTIRMSSSRSSNTKVAWLLLG